MTKHWQWKLGPWSEGVNDSLDRWVTIAKEFHLGWIMWNVYRSKQTVYGTPRVHYHITSLKHSCPGGIKPVQGRFRFSRKRELNILQHSLPAMNHQSWQSIGGCCKLNGSRETQHYRLCLALARYKLWTVESQRRPLVFFAHFRPTLRLKIPDEEKTHFWGRRNMLLSHVTAFVHEQHHFRKPFTLHIQD